jgi:hypothetical protein
MNKKEDDKKKSLFPLKVDYSKTEMPEEQRKLQEICNHSDVDVDISLEDGNFEHRKSTVISGYCPVCGKMETDEL